MKKLATILFFAASLIGCKSTPEQQLLQPIVEIQHTELTQYWTPKQSTFSFDVNTRKTPSKNGTVTVNYLIDSNGQIFNPKILKSTPDNSWNKFALEALKNTAYISAETNPQKIPVIVTTQIDFKAE